MFLTADFTRPTIILDVLQPNYPRSSNHYTPKLICRTAWRTEYTGSFNRLAIRR